jgi:hypothetical protein
MQRACYCLAANNNCEKAGAVRRVSLLTTITAAYGGLCGRREPILSRHDIRQAVRPLTPGGLRVRESRAKPAIAFSSEVDAGSREENASKQ